MKNPILITGIHRSGSTFVGKMLSLNKNVAYIQEPFNKDYGLKLFNINFKYLKENNIDDDLREALDQLVTLKKADYHIPSINNKFKGLKNRNTLINEFFDDINTSSFAKFLKRFLFKSTAQLKFNVAKYNPVVDRVLIKDPLACFASQYLHRKYHMDVVVLVRHPLSFAGSLKRLDWKFNFDNFLNQKQLMDDYLGEFREEMIYLNNKQPTVVEVACLLWNCIYKVLSEFIAANPDFIVIKHEDIAQNPVTSFKHLYSRLGLHFKPAIEQKIKVHTHAANPAEATDNRVHQLKRDSTMVIHNWRDILTEDEITYINQRTKNVAINFYDQDFFYQKENH